MSYVLGIDPSITSTGVCLLYNDKPPVFKTVGEPNDKPLAKRLWHLKTKLVQCLDQKSNPLLVAIETPISPLALGNHGGTGFNNNIMAYAMAYLVIGMFRLPYVNVSTKQRALVATGKGNANKDEVVEAFWNDVGYANERDEFNLNHNEIDAFWLATCASEVYQHRRKIDFNGPLFRPYGGWLDLDDKAYDMLEQLEIIRP